MQQDLGDIHYTNNATILGIQFGPTIAQTITTTWTDKIKKIRAGVQDYYIRQLDVQQRIRVCNVWLLSKIWYVAQLLPIQDDQANQIQAILLQYIWRGSIFRVSATTLYKKPTEGGLDMIHIKAKCDTLYFFSASTTATQPWRFHSTLAWLTRRLQTTPQPPQLGAPPTNTWISEDIFSRTTVYKESTRYGALHQIQTYDMTHNVISNWKPLSLSCYCYG